MAILQEMVLDDVREDVRVILALIPADLLHRLEELKLSDTGQDLVNAEVRRRISA